MANLIVTMKTSLRMFPFALVLCGAGLFAAGQFAKSDVTPLGQMDCGCGMKEECVTKNKAVHTGEGLTVAGGALLGLGALGAGASIVRRRKATAGA